MAQRALGNIAPASTVTGLRATNNQTIPAQAYPAQAIQFQALAGNTGGVYICDRAVPDLTLHAHVLIPPSSAGPPAIYPAWSAGNPAGQTPLNAADYWIVPTVSGEGVRVTVVR